MPKPATNVSTHARALLASSSLVLATSLSISGCSKESTPAETPATNVATAPEEAPSPQTDSPFDAFLDADENTPPLPPWPLEAAPGDWLQRSTQNVPLVAHLVVTTAVVQGGMDYESVKRIDSVEGGDVRISFNAAPKVADQAVKVRVQRVVRAADLASAHGYRMIFGAETRESYPGMTALGVSTAVLEELQGSGRSTLELHAAADLVGTLLTMGDALSSDLEGELVRVEAQPVAIPVMVNGERRWLRAIHARGQFDGLTRSVAGEFWFLADPSNPLTLRAQVDRTRLQVVRLDWPAQERSGALESELLRRGSVELWGIYFDTGSSTLRAESSATLLELAALLERHPQWHLAIEGHTDSIGEESTNLALSKRRAEAVRADLIARSTGFASHLDAQGFGELRPRESNDSASGRARNRRVELRRL